MCNIVNLSVIQNDELDVHIARWWLGGVLGGSEGKESAYSPGDLGSIPVSGRYPREGNGTPLKYSCLENPLDAGTWQATVHGVTKSQT